MKTLILAGILSAISGNVMAYYNTNYNLYTWERSAVYQNSYHNNNNPLIVIPIDIYGNNNNEPVSDDYQVKTTSNGDNLHEILTFGDE